jgi:hypothetical protein
VDGVPSTHCAQANTSVCTSCTTWLRWHGEALRTRDLTCTTWLTASPRHGEGSRTTGAGCRDIGGVGLGDSVTIASHGVVVGVRRARTGLGCARAPYCLRPGASSQAGRNVRGAEAGTSWACGERAGARLASEVGRSCYGEEGWGRERRGFLTYADKAPATA